VLGDFSAVSTERGAVIGYLGTSGAVLSEGGVSDSSPVWTMSVDTDALAIGAVLMKRWCVWVFHLVYFWYIFTFPILWDTMF